MIWPSARAAVAATLLLTTLPGLASAAVSPRERALQLAYNLDYEPALTILRTEVRDRPDDGASHRALASVIWLRLLFDRGAVTVDHYLGSLSRPSVDLPPPAPADAAEFMLHVERAIALADRRLARQPSDPVALYDLGAALGLRASYVATVEGRMLAGLKAARRAFDAHEQALALDPSRREAALIVGTYRYLVSTLSAPMRLMAYVAGFGGGREKGIALIQQAAAATGADRADALFALVLVYNRERRYDEALGALQELSALYPRNRLILLESGATALRARQFARAEQLLDRGLAMLAGESRPRMPGEEQLWRYKRGATLVAAGRSDAAAADLTFAAGAGGASWVRGRAHVEKARVALDRGDRAGARAEAAEGRALCATGRDPLCEADARALLRRSNGG